MGGDGEIAHDALVDAWEQVYAAAGARFERGPELIELSCPQLPVPGANGAWVVEDSPAAAAALPRVLAEVEAAGVQPWVQTRAEHERVREAALGLGLTHVERLPGMTLRPRDLAAGEPPLEIGPIAEPEVAAAVAVVAEAFDAPRELMEWFSRLVWSLDGVSWYVGRVDGEIVSTAVAYTGSGATGIFNVATPPQHRGRGYGAAVTARCARDGFDAGAEIAYLQSSELGHGVYRRLGFRDVEEYVLLTRPAT